MYKGSIYLPIDLQYTSDGWRWCTCCAPCGIFCSLFFFYYYSYFLHKLSFFSFILWFFFTYFSRTYTLSHFYSNMKPRYVTYISLYAQSKRFSWEKKIHVGDYLILFFFFLFLTKLNILFFKFVIFQ